MQLSELKLHVAAFGDPAGVGQRFRVFGKQRGHLVTGLQIELLAGKPHPRSVVDAFSGLDAQQHVMRIGIVSVDIVDVIGGDQADLQLAGQFDQQRDRLLLLGNSMVLNLDKKVVLAKNLDIFARRCFCRRHVALEDQRRNLAGNAGAKTDQPLVMFGQ